MAMLDFELYFLVHKCHKYCNQTSSPHHGFDPHSLSATEEEEEEGWIDRVREHAEAAQIFLQKINIIDCQPVYPPF